MQLNEWAWQLEKMLGYLLDDASWNYMMSAYEASRNMARCDKWYFTNAYPCWYYTYLDGLVQERCNFSELAMEVRLSCINPPR